MKIPTAFRMATVLALLGLVPGVNAEDYLLSTSFDNLWFSPGPPAGPFANYYTTNPATAVFGGHVLANTNNEPVPTDHRYNLVLSAFGQSIRSVRADVSLGDPILPPPGALVNKPPANFVPVQVGDNPAAYYDCTDPPGGAFWVPSTGQIIAAQPNSITVDWMTTTGQVKRVVYNVDAVPSKRPARIFWTEDPYLAPPVSLQGLYPVVHYNSQITPKSETYTTNVQSGMELITTNLVSGLWIDKETMQLRAKKVTGVFVLEYYKEGTYEQQVQPVGIEVVQVLAPKVQVITTDVGKRLMPIDTYWANMDGVNGVLPNVTRGQNDTVYIHATDGPKENWAFPIKRTYLEPWALEIYWQHRGIMGVLWPYEVDWFSCNWPSIPQLLVLDTVSGSQAPVLVPTELTAELQSDMDPPDHAFLSQGRKAFYTTDTGYSLLKYTSDKDVWFDVVKTVSNTNFLYFDLQPREWPIGLELVPGQTNAYALGFDGQSNHVWIANSFLNGRTNWTLSCWFKKGDLNDSVLYSEGNPGVVFSILLNKNLTVGTYNPISKWKTVTWENAPLATNVWHYLTLVYSDGTDSAGKLNVYLDDTLWYATGLPRVRFDGEGYGVIGGNIQTNQSPNELLYGKIDSLRIWNTALGSDQVRLGQNSTLPETAASLVADFEFNDGYGTTCFNAAGDAYGALAGIPHWGHGRVVPTGEAPIYPGYIHTVAGNAYNINRYAYPTEANPVSDSSVFAVNTGLLEVWWANRSRQSGMPAVYYPSHVARYTNAWPERAAQIVIASGLGSSGASLLTADDALYFNDTSTNYVLVPHNSALNVDELTVEAWVRLPAPEDTTTDHLIAFRSGQFYLGFKAGQLMAQFYLVQDGVAKYYKYYAGALPANKWTHIAMAVSQGDFSMYIDGQNVHSINPMNYPVRQVTTDLLIGRVLGSIGELRIWNRYRTGTEIAADKHKLLQRDEPGLVAYYPFVKGDYTYLLYDTGGYGLHGTIYNANWISPGRPVPVEEQLQFFDPMLTGTPAIYYQNEESLPGYNPNEEHSLLLGGVAYALRDDLNTAGASEPYTLVDYLDPATGRPKMLVFKVLATNELYTFHRNLTAGLPIIPPMPLGNMPLCSKNYSDTMPPAWKDRKHAWWAVAAGKDGGSTDAIMHFFYAMQPSFWFPALDASQQPPPGTQLPWLPTPFQPEYAGTNGIPVAITYSISWPDQVPTMDLGQTLTKATAGLPDIWDQLSVQVVYQQSNEQFKRDCVDLFDPVAERAAELPKEVIDEMLSTDLARRDSTSPIIRFPGLPPSLYPRLFYDPNRGETERLVLCGQRVETLTGNGYLLLNLLDESEKTAVTAYGAKLRSDLASLWQQAIESLPSTNTPILKDTPFVHAALASRFTDSGYVTLAFNNSEEPLQVPPALPVSLEIIQVSTNLYNGDLEVILPGDILAEQMSLRHSLDLAGHVSDCEFRWKWAIPAGGVIPSDDFESQYWIDYFGAAPSQGINEVLLDGSSPFTLADHFFAVQYRPRDHNGPSGSNWSDWSYNLAQGWVKRVMNGVNPFLQALPDMTSNPVDTRLSMISQAGGPYEGDVALNMDSVSQAGLIPVYETVFNRAKDFSIRAGISSPEINETLLFAASRLRDLYMLLGNEAFADAQNPTIAFPQELSQDLHGGTATSVFPFMNQVPNLLEEELALLRGRDDTFSPVPSSASPVYNRLVWNFTAGINGGEPAYAYNYYIEGNPSNTVGTITAQDAKRFYPQGHGDAWGHYLSAINHYYQLLASTNFGWQTEPSATLIDSSTTVTTDFFDEQKFAETAAARARTGAEIVKSTFRQQYSEIAGLLTYSDPKTNRAWGLSEWASRAGQAALYDWAVANSLMVDTLTNLAQVDSTKIGPPEGIQKIDRASTRELAEIAADFRDVQMQIDNANGGLNPLGLTRNTVPFDIDPTGIDSGQTHFDQVYGRALQALHNACIAFDQARGATAAMLNQLESLYDLQSALTANETDYHNRLVQLYGYPYSDDIGSTGTYPQGYDGPDLINWRIIDMENMVVDPPTTSKVVTNVIYNLEFLPGDEFPGHTYEDYKEMEPEIVNHPVATNYIHIGDNGLQVKPSEWTGRRRAQGELQLALSDFVVNWYDLQAKMAEYDHLLYELEVDMEHRQAEFERYSNEWALHETNVERQVATARIVEGLKITKAMAELVAESLKEIPKETVEAIPEIITGIVGIFPKLENKLKPSQPLKVGIVTTYYVSMIASQSLEAGIEGREGMQERWDAELEGILKSNEYSELLEWNTKETLVKLESQYVKQSELLAQIEAFNSSAERVLKLSAEGDRLIKERAQVRSRAAQRIQMGRYGDLDFRIFRDDALRRYQQTFDLAARYTYLAAKAYDYETGLLGSDTARTPGTRFIEDVVRARAPGTFFTWLGTPLIGGSVGEPGLADILARMKADWDVVKGRFGFNNPDTETSRFSLRTELFRISPDTIGDPTWAEVLQKAKVDNLNLLPEFIRYCRPYSDRTNVEPGLVIPFSTYVVAGKNYFGWDLAGGDNAYNASRAATKVRSAGVWFANYDNTFNTNTAAGGLANQPQVYLIPVGEDVMRSPTRNALQLRHWQVVDQAIPLPYNVGGAEIDNPDWLPVIDSLPEPFAQIRRFAAFRAYHDSGNFDPAETIKNSRLVGRSVWNTRWLLIIPGRTLLSDPVEGIERFIHGNPSSSADGIKDIKIFFQTYSIQGD